MVHHQFTCFVATVPFCRGISQAANKFRQEQRLGATGFGVVEPTLQSSCGVHKTPIAHLGGLSRTGDFLAP